ncbi:MAG: Crp/Fnr family transcriptional regulator [Bacteroidota bacterium]
MGTSSFAYLKQLNVNSLTEANWDSIFDVENARKFKKGTYLFLPEEQADKIYFIVEGSVKVGTYGAGGREITKAIYRSEDILGEEAVFGEKQRRNFAYTLEPVVIASLNIQDFQKAIRRQHSLHLELLKVVGQRLLETEQRLESMVFKNSRSRIIEFLHQMGVRQGQRVGYEMLVRKFLTHQEIANLTATSRQTVTTILNELRNANVITFNRKRLLIRDMDRLAGMVA